MIAVTLGATGTMGGLGRQATPVFRTNTERTTDLVVIPVPRASIAVQRMGRSIRVTIVLRTLERSTITTPAPLPPRVGQGGVIVPTLCRGRSRAASRETILVVNPGTSTQVKISEIIRVSTRTPRNQLARWP